MKAKVFWFFSSEKNILPLLAVVLPLSQAVAQPRFPNDDAARQRRYLRLHGDMGSAAGAFLCGQFAMSEGQYGLAAIQLLAALEADPRSPEISRAALVATLLAGRPERVPVANQVVRLEPGNPIAQLVLAGEEARIGHWQAAAQHYAAVSGEGVFALLRQPLLAWAQFGAGRRDSMRILLHPPGAGSQSVGGFYLFQAGLMADLANQADEARRFYLTAQAEIGPDDFGVARALASLQARQGQVAQAQRTLAAARIAGVQLEASEPRLEAAMGQLPVRDAGDGIAAIYASFALLAREHRATVLSDMLFRLAFDLRPDFSSARLQAAVVLTAENRTRAALAMLSAIGASDVLAPSADVLRAVVLEKQREKAK